MTNKTVTCVIVDDEYTARYGVRSYIHRIDFLCCKGEFHDVASLAGYLPANDAPDIIFMDIQMPGITGLDFIASQTIRSAVIIITAHEKYALKGFELNVCDYLLKPVPFARFCQAIDKAVQYIEYQKGQNLDNYMFVRADRMLHRLDVKDIAYIESMGNYVRITSSQERIVARMTFKELKSSLPTNGFMQVHKSYIVNLSHVKSVGNGTVVLDMQIEIPLSKTFRQNIIDFFTNRNA